MRLRYVLAVVMGLALSVSLTAGRKKTAPVAPEKRSFSIPVSIPNANNPQSTPGECVVSAGPAIPVSAVAFTADSKRLFVGGYKEVLVWDLEEIKLAQRLGAGQSSGRVRAVALSKDGKKLALAEGTPGVSGAVRLLDIASGKVAATFAEANDEFVSLAAGKKKTAPVAPEKRSFSIPVSIPNPNNPQSTPGECVVTAGPAIPISAVAFTADSKRLFVGGYKEVLVWDLEEIKLAQRLGAGQLSGRVRAVAFSKDGKNLALAEGTPGVSGAVRLMDVASGKIAATLAEAKDEFISLAFSSDGKLLAAGGSDGAVRVWNTDDQKLVKELKQHGDWVSGIAFSPDGKFLASGSIDKTVQIWEAGAWNPIVKLPQPLTESVHGLAFSPNSEFLAIAVGGAEERAIRIWRTASVEESRDTPANKGQRRDTVRQTRPIDTGACSALGVVWGPPPAGAPASAAAGRMFVPCTVNSFWDVGRFG